MLVTLMETYTQETNQIYSSIASLRTFDIFRKAFPYALEVKKK